MISWRSFTSGLGHGMKKAGVRRWKLFPNVFHLYSTCLACTCCYHGRGQLLRVGGVSFFSAVVLSLDLWIVVIVRTALRSPPLAMRPSFLTSIAMA